jgi:hypothetical protein
VDAEAIEAEETSGEPELKKYELAPSSLILSLSPSACCVGVQADVQRTDRQERSRRRTLD